MIPEIKLEAEGFLLLDKELKNFKEDIKVKARRAGLVEMAKPIKKTLKNSIPVGSGYDNTGSLRKSIGHASVSNKDKSVLGLGSDDAAIIVGSTRKVLDKTGTKRFQHFRLNWLDKGVEGHWLNKGVTHQKRMRVKGRFVSGEVWHPGVRAMNLLQNAYNKHRGEFERRWSIGAARALKRYRVKVT